MQSLTATAQPANMYLFKVNTRSNRKRFEIYSNLTTKTPVNDVVLLFLLLTLNMFYTFSEYFYCWLRTTKYLLGSLLILTQSYQWWKHQDSAWNLFKNNKDTKTMSLTLTSFVLESLLLSLNRFHKFFWCFNC